MKIGILTLPLHTNYGGILQAYALQTILERMGHQVVVFDKPLEKVRLPLWKKPLTYAKRFIKKYVFKRNTEIFQEATVFARQCKERQYTQPFINHNIHRYEIHYLTDIRESDFDCIVVGSDQIWRMLYFKSFWSTKNAADAFLDFTNGWNIKRVAYAASFGIEDADIPDEEINLCKRAIQKFDKVSVREESGVSLCKKLFNIEAKWVLDPTMLLKVTEYINLLNLNSRSNVSNGTLMSYILDENEGIANLRKKIANDKNLKINLANIADTGSQKRGVYPQPPIENWLHSFIQADYVINDSFHACVFSILFHKQFTVIGNKKRGLERFISLLKMFNLEDRLITEVSDYKPLPDIDYIQVDKILTIKRKEALDFLQAALN